MSANLMRDELFETKAFGGRSNIEELKITNENLNRARRLTIAKHANQISTIAPSSDLGITIFISNSSNDPVRKVNDWFCYQTYKMVNKAYAKNQRKNCNMIIKKKLYLEMIFQ